MPSERYACGRVQSIERCWGDDVRTPDISKCSAKFWIRGAFRFKPIEIVSVIGNEAFERRRTDHAEVMVGLGGLNQRQQTSSDAVIVDVGPPSNRPSQLQRPPIRVVIAYVSG